MSTADNSPEQTWAVGVEYRGTAYHGWQAQTQPVATVQQTVEKALSFVNGSPIEVICAGRTDTGVHAFNQVIHFHTDQTRDERAWLLGSNSKLPGDISLRWARRVPSNFHARYSALSRRYCYLIDNTPTTRPGIWSDHLTWVLGLLDEQAMQAAANTFIGRHDFSAFRSSHCQANSPYRTIHGFSVTRQGHQVQLEIQANAFLHHMVRNLVGCLLKIGKGEQPVEWAKTVLASKDRRQAGITAPASGLYFIEASYPPEFNIPMLEVMQPLVNLPCTV